MADTTGRDAGAPHRGVAVEEIVDSVRHPLARRIADVLRSRSARPKIFVIDDTENIEQALRCGVQLDSIFVTAGVENGLASILAPVQDTVPHYVLSESVATILFGGDKRARTFALAQSPPRPHLRDLSTRPGDILVLDGVRLVGNIGAITRTACALGAAGLVLLDSGLTTTLDRRLVRASRGLIFAIPVVQATRSEFADYARREKLALATLTAGAAEPLALIRDAPERLALIMGGERNGISGQLDVLASYRYAIPMSRNVESLNVSVAAGIALYVHQRTTCTPGDRLGQLSAVQCSSHMTSVMRRS